MWPWLTFSGIDIPTFVLVQCVNACLLLLWASRRASRFDLPKKLALDLAFLLLVCGLVGARLLHVFWENPEIYRQEPVRIFDLLSGGYVYYGGFLFSILCGALFLKVLGPKKSWGTWFDFAAPLLSFGTALGRVGCFLSGCCYGQICNLPWAIESRHPTALYSLFWELGVLLILLGLDATPAERRLKILRPAGSLFLLWMILHGLGRFLIERWRDDFRGQIFLLSISQWISLLLILIGITLLGRRRQL